MLEVYLSAQRQRHFADVSTDNGPKYFRSVATAY